MFILILFVFVYVQKYVDMDVFLQTIELPSMSQLVAESQPDENSNEGQLSSYHLCILYN